MPSTSGPRDLTVLVTGGAGFIGSHLVDALLTDNDVDVLDDGSGGALDGVPDAARLVQADVRDETVVTPLLEEVDVVYHLAAVVSVDDSIADPRRSHSVNVGGTLTVLEAARATDTRVVLTSSAAIYGDPASVPVAEDAPTAPKSPYGVDKLAADHYARRYADLYGVETVVLRPFNVYGPDQTGEYAGVISTFVDQATAGEPITVHGDGAQTRDFVHVDDAVAALELAATTEYVGEAFNIGTGEEVSIRLLAETVRNVADADSEIVHTDPRLGDIDRSCADISATRGRLGFSPSTGLEAGLGSLVDDE